MNTPNDVKTSATTFDALVEEEIATTKCSSSDAVGRITAKYPALARVAFDAKTPLTAAQTAADKESQDAARKFNELVEAEMSSSKCDTRTALERVKRREPDLTRKAFRGLT